MNLRLFILVAAVTPLSARAQMTVSGRVLDISRVPVLGAEVSIPALEIVTRTAADGRYAFIIRQSQVMGQTVSVTARHGRFGAQTVQIRIVGGALEQNFVLGAPAADRPRPARGDTGGRGARSAAGPAHIASILLDESSAEFAGSHDLARALAGRLAALQITASTTPGGSAAMLYRGARSLSARVQPLVLVDGVPVDNESFTTIAQRFGQGGYDYGSPLADISLDDIARVELLDPVSASIRHGSRAANGVIAVSTKSGRNFTGFGFAVTQRVTGQQTALHPELQNSYGQGLNGQYEFFDGQGGGINDGVAESWGPLLDARPIVQHSLTEPGRPDVRHWIPQPDDVDEYFGGGSTYDAMVALLGSRESSHMRVAASARSVSGPTPRHSASRLGLAFAGGTRFARQLSATANLQIVSSNARQRPGTGFDEVNPASGFMRMGRQVDLDALRSRVTDANGDQINWIYTSHNNPFFATSLNSNVDDRMHFIGGVSLGYEIAPWLSAALHGGVDDWSASRDVTVANGWLGGFPTTLGRGSFTGGGSDEHEVSAAERLVQLSIEMGGPTAIAGGFSWSGLAGADIRSSAFRSNARVVDQPVSGDPIVQAFDRSGTHDVTGFFASATAAGRHLTLTGGLRVDQSSSLSKSHSALYPGAQVVYDLTQMATGLRLASARLFARFWQAGNEVTARTLATLFVPPSVPDPDFDIDRPERTTGFELGARATSRAGRFGFDLKAYRERSVHVLVVSPTDVGGVSASQSGEIFNGGLEAGLRARVLGAGAFGDREDGLSWDLDASVARNSSTIDQLAPAGNPGEFAVPLSPNLFGVRFAAQIGHAAGIILGSRQLRDDAGQLLLRNGLPIADASSPLVVLGSVHPDWTASVRGELRVRDAGLSLLFDSRMGGKIFSATNIWGSYAGSLESTLIGDRAPGAASGDSLVIAGIDSMTGTPNAVQVSAQQFFHALGAISEPWVYDASYIKLREARLSYEIATRFLPGFRDHFLRMSIVGRNLFTWARAPNIDPETTLGTAGFSGFEMGQLPTSRSIGVQITIAP
jgi:hypothetical protein